MLALSHGELLKHEFCLLALQMEMRCLQTVCGIFQFFLTLVRVHCSHLHCHLFANFLVLVGIIIIVVSSSSSSSSTSSSSSSSSSSTSSSSSSSSSRLVVADKPCPSYFAFVQVPA